MNKKERRKDQLAKAKNRTGFPDAFYVEGKGVCFRNMELRRCSCGGEPVIEPSVYEKTRAWVIRCPKCDLRAAAIGKYKKAKADWNGGRFSPDSVLISSPLRYMDLDGAIQLIGAILREEDNKPGPEGKWKAKGKAKGKGKRKEPERKKAEESQ